VRSRPRRAVRVPSAAVRGVPVLGSWAPGCLRLRIGWNGGSLDGPALVGLAAGWASPPVCMCYVWAGGGKTAKAQVANANARHLLQPPALLPVEATAAAMLVCVAGAHELAGEDVYILVRSQI
jgi:hypothetical protein